VAFLFAGVASRDLDWNRDRLRQERTVKTLILIATVLGLAVLGGCAGLTGGVQDKPQSQDDLDRAVERASRYAAIVSKTLDDTGVDGNVLLDLEGQPANVYAKQEFGLELPVHWRITTFISARPRQLLNELAKPESPASGAE
jgi:hypothetical protein